MDKRREGTRRLTDAELGKRVRDVMKSTGADRVEVLGREGKEKVNAVIVRRLTS